MVVSALNLVSNLAIVGGYLLVPPLVLPYLRLSVPIVVAGALFFITCAVTHLALAFGEHNVHAWWMVVNHVVQAVSVVTFILGFGRLLRRAHERARGMPDSQEQR